jgi:hypothetical protein
MHNVSRAIIIIVLGIFINVIVAWACALFSTLPSESVTTNTSSVRHGFGVVAINVDNPSRTKEQTVGITAGGIFRPCAYYCGFPLYSMHGTWFRRHCHNAVPTTVFGRYSGMLSKRIVPLAPLWTGFFANSALYAVLVWIAGFYICKTLKSRRRKHHQCECCGYPVVRNVICPECGRLQSFLLR